jgi:antitoxin component of RelBE/YafQ-DinJ toxin-antitoxin module
MTSAKARFAPRHPDPKIVRQAEEIFAGIQMTPAKAFATFYKLTALRGDGIKAGASWDAESLAAFGEPRKSIVIYTIVDEMMADLWEAVSRPSPTPASGAMITKEPTPTDVALNPSDSATAQKAESIFAQMGMKPEEAIATFYERTARHEECLLCLAYGNTLSDETLADLQVAQAGLGIKKYASVDEMMADLWPDA